MSKSVIGLKMGMTQWWNENKEAEAVTLVDCSGLVMVGERNKEKDGYEASIMGILKPKKKDKKDKFTIVKECKKQEDAKIGLFKKNEKVKVSGISKGKGFQGVVKRHGFSGGPKTHGHRHALRSAGSVGCAFPEHVMKGKKMAGRMGNQQVTVKNLEIAWVDEEKNIIAVKGALPGRKGSWIKIVSQEAKSE